MMQDTADGPVQRLRQVLSSPSSHRISSLAELRSLLLPVLEAFDLISDGSGSGARGKSKAREQNQGRTERQRHLTVVQALILEHPSLLPDWSSPLQQEPTSSSSTATLLDALIKPFFVPSTAEEDENLDVAISALEAISGYLSNKTPLLASSPEASSSTRRKLHPTTLSLALAFAEQNLSSLTLSIVHRHIFAQSPAAGKVARESRLRRWKEVVHDLLLIGLPTRAANAVGRSNEESGRESVSLPESLDYRSIIPRRSKQLAVLLHELSTRPSQPRHHPRSGASSVAVVIAGLVRLGAFPTSSSIGSTSSTSGSFWEATWPDLLAHVVDGRDEALRLWRKAVQSLDPEPRNKVVASLIVRCQTWLSGPLRIGTTIETSSPHEQVQREEARTVVVARILFGLLGPLRAPDPPSGAGMDDLEDGSSDEDQSSDDSILFDLVFQSTVLPSSAGWSPLLARSLVRWVTLSTSDHGTLQVISLLALQHCSDSRQISVGSVSRHTFLALLVLLPLASITFPRRAEVARALSEREEFFTAVAEGLKSLRGGIRHLGMLVAELVTGWATGQQEGGGVDFGKETWEGAGEGREVAREVRTVVSKWQSWEGGDGWKAGLREWADEVDSSLVKLVPRPAPPVNPARKAETSKKEAPPAKKPMIQVIGDDEPLSSDDDDELRPFASGPPVQNDPLAPTLEELETGEIGLHAIRKKPPRDPVYVQEVSEYLRDTDNVERLRVGLEKAEEVIRRKAGWGTELEENAIDLLFALTNLQDNYDLPSFDLHLQKALTALIVCVPKKAAPSIIEQFFSSDFSISQRVGMLNALAIGSRELAGLEVPEVKGVVARRDADASVFPTKKLPGRLHEQLIRLQLDAPEDDLARLNADVTRLALTNAREGAEQSIPEAAREKSLTVGVGQTGTVNRINPSLLKKRSDGPNTSARGSTYYLLAAEYFVMPLVNHMWTYLHDVAAVGLGSGKGAPYRGTGYAILLEPMLLSRYVQLLSVLLFPARNAPTFQSVLAPEVLALAITLKASGLSSESAEEDTTGASLLELVLVVLDACVGLDGGRALTRGQDGMRLVVEVKEWAEATFTLEEARAGPMGRAGRAAAAVLIRTEEIVGRFRGNFMVNM